MNLENAPQAILAAVFCIIVAMGLWYLGLSRGSLKIKQIAVMIGIFPLLIVAISFFGNKLTAVDSGEFRGGAVFGSSSRRTGPVTDETAFDVDTPGKTHQIQLVPKVWGGAIPQQDTHLHYTVRSPSGGVVVQGDADSKPDKNKLPRWTPVIVQFQPSEEGKHILALEVPVEIGSVDILVKELK